MRAAGPASDMRIADGAAFFAVDGIGRPERALPYRSEAGCTVERRRASDIAVIEVDNNDNARRTRCACT